MTALTPEEERARQVLRQAAAMPAGVTLDDPHARLASGMTVAEAVRRACAWWDSRGRHVVRNPEFRDPDVGFRSGILRGLPFADLTADEATRVIVVWHQQWERDQEAGANAVRPPARRRFRP